jgi:hypothetical protein
LFSKRPLQNVYRSRYSGRSISLNIANSRSIVYGSKMQPGGQIAGAVVVAIGEMLEGDDAGVIEGGLDKISFRLSSDQSMSIVVIRPVLEELWP